MKPQITVIGSSNVDFIMRLERLPAVGETVTGGEFAQTFGGKGANQAVAAARAGGAVTFVSAVGDDSFGAQMIDNFARDGITTDHIFRSPDHPSGSALVMFDGDGNNYLSVAPGANYALRPTHIEAARAQIAASKMVIMQMELEVETLLFALDECERAQTPVLFNFAPARTLEVPITAKIHGLIVNEIEAEQLTETRVTDTKSARHAALLLLEKGPRFVVVTLGAQGALWSTPTGNGHERVRAVKAVDTTAAGDTFCGALAVALCEGRELPDAVRFANAASALAVTRLGAQPSIPARAEINGELG